MHVLDSWWGAVQRRIHWLTYLLLAIQHVMGEYPLYTMQLKQNVIKASEAQAILQIEQGYNIQRLCLAIQWTGIWLSDQGSLWIVVQWMTEEIRWKHCKLYVHDLKMQNKESVGKEGSTLLKYKPYMYIIKKNRWENTGCAIHLLHSHPINTLARTNSPKHAPYDMTR